MNAAAAIRVERKLVLSKFQQRTLMTPETIDLFLGGGRGGGKSTAIALLFLRHAEQFGSRARMLYCRRNFPGIVDFESTCREVFGLAYGPAASYNASTHLWRFPGGATLQLDQMEGVADFGKFQGKSYSLIGVDELGLFPDPAPIDLLRSCLRAAAPLHPRMIEAANPGGPGHGWIVRRRQLLTHIPWLPYGDSSTGRTFINAPSVYTDNPNLDAADYQRQLAAACATDPELYRAWADGDWSVARGAFFSAVLDEQRVSTDPWQPEAVKWMVIDGWSLFLAHDFGVSAPSVTYVCAESPGALGPDGRYYAKGSVVLVDELATCERDSLTRGMGYTVPALAERIKALAARWNMRPEGNADDSIFAKTGHGAGSIADEFRKVGVYFNPAKKADRWTGWEVMRRMLADAGKPDKPGLYVSKNCQYWWATVPTLPRDPRNADDVDSNAADHGADACRYGLLRLRVIVTSEPLRI